MIEFTIAVLIESPIVRIFAFMPPGQAWAKATRHLAALEIVEAGDDRRSAGNSHTSRDPLLTPSTKHVIRRRLMIKFCNDASFPSK